MNLKGEIESIAKELGEYAASEEARGTLYVSGKIEDIRVYLKGLWSKPIALSVAVIALALGHAFLVALRHVTGLAGGGAGGLCGSGCRSLGLGQGGQSECGQQGGGYPAAA